MISNIVQVLPSARIFEVVSLQSDWFMPGQLNCLIETKEPAPTPDAQRPVTGSIAQSKHVSDRS